jgi:hypothetical protein
MDFKESTVYLNKIPIQQVAGWLGATLPKKAAHAALFLTTTIRTFL